MGEVNVMKKSLFPVAFIAFFVGLLAHDGMGEEPRRLRILLTNDDGYDAPGIQAMYRALLDKGYDVMIVAPADQQSGTGVAVSIRTLIDIVKKDEGKWAIAERPADAVLVGLEHLLREIPPDLVVSGANFGENLGVAVFSSGTVGAAIMAMHRGFPAIAVSVGSRSDESDAEPPYRSTVEAFADAGNFTAQIIERLEESRFEEDHLLPGGTILNINYPALPVGEINGIKWTRLGKLPYWRFTYREAQETGAVRLVLAKGSALEIGGSPLADVRSQETGVRSQKGGGGCAAASDQFSHHLNLRDEFSDLTK
jgi:5'-nucleotidase